MKNPFSGFRLRRARSSQRRDPAHDWAVLLTLASVALVGIVAWNAWAFSTVTSGGTIGSPVPLGPTVFDRSSIDTITTIFAKRAAEEAAYATSTYRFADPSQ